MSVTIRGTDTSAAAPSFTGTDGDTGMFFPAADTIAFAEGGTEVARFDSAGNLGIGTTNPGIYSTSARVLSVNTSAGNNTVAMALVNAAGDTNTSVSLDFVPNTNITLAQIQGFRTNAFGGATDFRFLSYNGSSLAERMRIDSSGRVTMPAQPMFSAYSVNASVITTSNTPRIMPYTSVLTNTGGFYSSNRFTAPVAGRYLFSFSALALTGGGANLILFKNGVTLGGSFTNARSITNTNEANIAQSVIATLAASDYIEVYYYNDGASNSFYGAHGSFCGTLLG